MGKCSVVVLTKNEEDNIRACLETVKWADEIIIVDDMSADKTTEIAREYTEKIFVRKMDGFGEQRQYATKLAAGPWVLFLDADERLTSAVIEEMRKVIEGPSAYPAYSIPKVTFYLGRHIRHCGWSMASTRLFQKGQAKWNRHFVHEEVVVDGPVGTLKNSYEHHSYRSISQHLRKLDHYSSLEARHQFEGGRRIKTGALLFVLTIKPAVAFLRKWILMGGILDGAEGFLISIFTALTVFFNFVKLWELQKNEERQTTTKS